MVMLWATVRYGVVGFLSTDPHRHGVHRRGGRRLVAPAIMVGVVVLSTVTSWVTLRRYLRV